MAKTSNSTSKKLAPTKWCFPKGTVPFLTKLRANNNREWFTQNKADYERDVLEPGADFCELMTVEFEKLTGKTHNFKIFRVHRDVRFSKDKTPYKAHLHILFRPAEGGDGGLGVPAWFFGLEPDKLVLGAGIFGFEKSALDTYRQRVAGPEGKRLQTAITKLQSKDFRLRDPQLKRVPQGYAADHERADLLRHKGLTIWADHAGGPKAAVAPKLVTSCAGMYRQMKPVFDWLSSAG
ncbi:MAG: DUF2461 domain-containing protein [Hyphomicrobiaceae bacterium]